MKMIKIALVAFSAFYFCACHSQTQNPDSDVKGFQNSQTYKDYLSTYSDKNKTIESDKRFFTLMGEEAFLQITNHQLYVIYLYKASRDSTFHIYILKSKNGLSLASHKTENINTSSTTADGFDKEEVFKGYVITRIVDEKQILPIKESLNKSVGQIKKVHPSDYDSPTRIFFYYDGFKYHRLSAYQLDESELNGLDSMFRNSLLFQGR